MKKTFLAAILLALVFGGASRAGASMVTLEGNANFWWLVHEQVENGRLQSGTKDQAAQEASGFNFKQGRLGFRFLSDDGSVEGLIRFRLEERTDVIDAWGAWHAAPWFTFQVGLMKFPNTGEALMPDHKLDYITRTNFSQNCGDFSMSRTPYISLLMATTSNNRDMGIAFKGRVGEETGPGVNYFIMIGNGVGGNLYIGGEESSEYYYTNNFGDFLYAGRLEAEPISGLVIGGHYSYNTHDDAVFKDKKNVFDLERTSWSADVSARLPWDTRIYAFYGEGDLDDFWAALDYEFDYQGYGVSVMQGLFDNRLEVGVRFDSFTTEFSGDGNDTEQKDWTFAINLNPAENFRVQMNYIDKDTVNDFVDDKKDNIFIVNFQFFFNTGFEGA